MKQQLFLPCLAFLLVFSVTAPAQDWRIVPGKIVSKFAKDVDPKNPLPEYPRPQMVRDAWLNLNGLWDYAVVSGDVKQPETYDGKILVPYPVESSLSGVGKNVGKDETLVYKRTFEIPKGKEWDGRRVLLHFGAVDWEAVVTLNGQPLGKHTGGYTPFSFDATDALKADGPQELIVAVTDPTDAGFQPRGKQVRNPNGIWYTAVTGIWQTVWLEPVAATSIESLKMTPNIKDGTLTLETVVNGTQPGDIIDAKATVKSRHVNLRGPLGRPVIGRRNQAVETVAAFAKTEVGKPVTLSLPNAKLWTPDSPHLYDLTVSVIRNGKVVDTVDSYFAMREIALGKDDKGITRMMLNGKFVFQHGPLDQGWWPDGLYTAPTDEALAYDVVVTKKLGFNMLRKHVKVEPARFYHHCDELGMLVWQDMPSGDQSIGGDDPDVARTPESAANFEKEWKEVIEAFYNSPCIVVWVPFNEGWGQFDTCRILEWTKQLDPTRLVDGPSGWTDRGCGDMHDMHAYRGPGMFPAEENRASVLGEYGGLGLPITGHAWVESDKNWGYGGNLKDRDDLLAAYMGLNFRMHPMIGKGLSAAVYTQTTDVEVEVNGLMTYDREIIKVDVEKFRALNDALRYPAPDAKVVVPTALEKEFEWAYTTDEPADGWEKADFDDSAWEKGPSGFGTRGTPGAVVRTEWKTDNIWIRRSVELTAEDVRDPSQLVLDIHHDEDAEVYVNGVKVCTVTDFTSGYAQVPMTDAAKAFKTGRNVIAVHCKQTRGGQYIDLGFSRIIPATGKHKRVW